MNRIRLGVLFAVSICLPGCLPQSFTCIITSVGQSDELPEILADLERIRSVEGAVGACADYIPIENGEGREIAAERDGLLDTANVLDEFSPSLRELNGFLNRRSSTLSEKTFAHELFYDEVTSSDLTTQAGRDRIRSILAGRGPVYALHTRFTAASTAIRTFCRRAYELRAQARVTSEQLTALMELRANLVGRFSELRSLLTGPTFEQIRHDYCADEGETEETPANGTTQALRAPGTTQNTDQIEVHEIVETRSVSRGR